MKTLKELFINNLKTINATEEMIANDDSCVWDKDNFHKIFTKPEILVGFYLWRASDDITEAYELFMLEYDGWIDSCKSIASESKVIIEKLVKKGQGKLL